MTRILVALDGSPFAERAAEPARMLADRTDAELHLVSIVEDVPSPFLSVDTVEFAGSRLEAQETRAGAYLEAVEKKLRDRGATATIRIHVGQGSPGRALAELGQQIEADLIVLTTHGHGGLKRLWLGSTADRLMRISPIPMLLLRAADEVELLFQDSAYPHHILVPLDGSEAAETVLSRLPLLGPLEETRITLASVLHNPLPFPAVHFPEPLEDKATLQEERERAEQYLETVRSGLETNGIGSVSTRILEHADVSRTLLDFCSDSSVDLIALTTHGRGAMGRTFVGSVADKLVRSSELPVLAIRRPE